MRGRGLTLTACVLGLAAFTPSASGFEARSLDGGGNNVAHPAWGQAGTPYRRVARARYADGAGEPARGPNARYLSNRVFNDLGQNVFSERDVSQWVWTWGQFMDHTFGLGREGTERRPIAFAAGDPLERFRNDLGSISFKRDAAAPGTGTSAVPREQVNTVSSYIDGWSVYGGTRERLEWLRVGPVDGSMANNGSSLMLTADGYLPRAGARGNAAAAPAMALDGGLRARPQAAVVAGDVRANENMALTAVHTLFAREHNRIVRMLPAGLSAEERFQIARRVVGAEQQFITYREFLPAAGVKLPPYRGYDPSVNASLGNEFATVAYRAHSMIHGEFEIEVSAADMTPAEIAALAARGVEVGRPEPAEDGEPAGTELVVPLGLAFFNPDIVPAIGLGPILAGMGREAQYRNDEQIDDALRSVLFQLPGPGAPDPAACFGDPSASGCFQGVVDLGALDVERGRDHGMPTYNALRRAFGLAPRRSFRAITGERSERFPRHRLIDARAPIDDPDSLGFVKLRDRDGRAIPRRSEEAEEGARFAVRRTPLAARLKAIYGSVKKVDAFVGMVAEPHVRGSELGELQRAIWRQQFHALRAGDRFFYRHDAALEEIRSRYGVDYRHTLGDLIALNTTAPRGELPDDVFRAAPDD
ncbi:MAG TPA: peroxidase family protein [Thermoleophilaceae bacterium]|jgi:hypothetical protein